MFHQRALNECLRRLGARGIELGLRLRSAGWKLKRIDRPSVRHHTHQLGAYSFLARRWRDGFALGAGELLRSAIGKSYLPSVLREFRGLLMVAGWIPMLVLIVSVPVTLPLRLAALIALLAAPVSVLSVKRRSVQVGLYTVVAHCFVLVAAIRGALRSQVDPAKPIDNQVLQRGEWFQPRAQTKLA